MKTRITETTDSKGLAKIAKEIWNEYYPTVIGQDHVDYILSHYQTASKIAEDMENGFLYYFVYEGTKKIGYVSFVVLKDEIYLSKLYLKKEARGRGIGEFILEMIKGIALSSSRHQIRLNVNRHNIGSVVFYKKQGFTIKEEVNVPIGNGLEFNDYIMVKEV